MGINRINGEDRIQKVDVMERLRMRSGSQLILESGAEVSGDAPVTLGGNVILNGDAVLNGDVTLTKPVLYSTPHLHYGASEASQSLNTAVTAHFELERTLGAGLWKIEWHMQANCGNEPDVSMIAKLHTPPAQAYNDSFTLGGAVVLPNSTNSSSGHYYHELTTATTLAVKLWASRAPSASGNIFRMRISMTRVQ